MIKKRSKRYKENEKLVDENRAYPLDEAVEIIKKFSLAKFDESVEINFQLGIDPKQSTQIVRGTVSLPNGSGKDVKVIVFCRGEELKAAEDAGADYVGADDLINKVASGWIDFDVVVAHPNVMKDISRLGKVLGPRGLMPSPKVGTVTQDIGKAVSDLKKGKIEFKSDRTAGLHVACGKVSFEKEKLIENIKAVIRTIIDYKPASAKGTYMKSISLSSSMGPGLLLDTSSLSNLK